MDVNVIIAMLRSTLQEPDSLGEVIAQLQQAVFHETVNWSGAVEEILRDLAYDLDYYQPDPRVRCEDSTLIDEEKALAEIEAALQRIHQSGQ